MEIVELTWRRRGPVLVADIGGEIDMSNSDELRAELEREVSNEIRGLVVDLSRTSYVDSAGMQLFYELTGRLTRRGQRLAIVVPPGSPAADALRYGAVLESLCTAASEDECLAAVEQ